MRHQVEQAFLTARRHAGVAVTYKRFKEMTYHPDTGETKTFWEEVALTAVAGSVTQRELEQGGGTLQVGDRWIVLPKSAFTKQAGEQAEPEPREGDEVVFPDGTVWGPVPTGSAQERSAVFREDPTGTLWQVFLRRLG